VLHISVRVYNFSNTEISALGNRCKQEGLGYNLRQFQNSSRIREEWLLEASDPLLEKKEC